MEKIKNLFNNLDKTDLKIMKKGINFSFLICTFSSIILIFYLLLHNLFLYNLGISIFKLSMYISLEFIICGIIVDFIKKQMN